MPMNAKVLIVDDDSSIVRLLSVCCAKLGLTVQTAENGLQAIMRASRNPPRLIILDLHMPETDGFRVCELLLDPINPKRAPVDIIVLTALSDDETINRCESLGAYHVPKGPEAWDMIQSVLGELLELDDLALASFAPSKADPASLLLCDKIRNKVLIVEDDADLAEALARRFRRCGAVTLVAPDGLIGYRTAVREQPDVIITDYLMPEGGGHYMIWRLKSTVSTRRIPVIAITGEERLPDRMMPLDRETRGLGGAIRCFQKPLDIDALLAEVSHHCDVEYNPFEAAR
jgi:CheY-like chemotaxis protein